MRDLPDLMQRYGIELKPRGNRYECKCYAHDDATPSMSVYRNGDGKWHAHCFVCSNPQVHDDAYSFIMRMESCGFKDAKKIVEGEPFTPSELPPPLKEELKTSGEWHTHAAPAGSKPDSFAIKGLDGPTQVWEYKSATGETLGYVCRYIKDKRKTYRPWTYGRYGEIAAPLEWKALSWRVPRPLYGLDRLRDVRKVLICEGEKAADAAQKLVPAMDCVTWPGGAPAARYIDWTPLRGRDVILCPDADEPGMAAMKDVAAYLLSINCYVKLIDTTDMPEGWDLADADGWTQEKTVEWARARLMTVTSGELEAKKKQQSEAAKKALEADQPEINTQALPVTQKPTESNPDKPEIVYQEEIEGNVVRLKAIKVSEYLPEAFSHDALATAWSADAGQDYKYVAKWNKWIKWSGGKWDIDHKNSIFFDAMQKMREVVNWPSAMNLSRSQKASIGGRDVIKAVLACASAFPQHVMLPDELDADDYLLGTPDGVVDLRSGKLREPEQDDYITKSTAVAPKRGPMPYWDMVLSRCTNGDESMRQYYQRWAGYMLTGDTKEEAFLFVHGEGNSGKSKFIDCLGDMLGDYCTTAKIEMLMESKIERHTSEIAALAGARMVRSSEPEEGARWNEALLKLITGRDTISARRLYEEQFTFRPKFKLVIGGNFRPALKSTGEEIRRRMHFANFPGAVPPEQRIYDLPAKLESEWPAILQWAIDGCLDWQAYGLGRPEAVEEATKDYLDDEDTFGAWLDECCERCNDRVTSGEAYKSYRHYVEARGEGIVSQKRFSGRLEARGFGRIKTGGIRYVTGLRLRGDLIPKGRYDN